MRGRNRFVGQTAKDRKVANKEAKSRAEAKSKALKRKKEGVRELSADTLRGKMPKKDYYQKIMKLAYER